MATAIVMINHTEKELVDLPNLSAEAYAKIIKDREAGKCNAFYYAMQNMIADGDLSPAFLIKQEEAPFNMDWDKLAADPSQLYICENRYYKKFEGNMNFMAVILPPEKDGDDYTYGFAILMPDDHKSVKDILESGIEYVG